MAIKYKDIENIDYNRKIEIIERTIFIKQKFNHLINNKISYGIKFILDTLYYQYRKYYKDNLNEIEQIIFNVYTVFPNNDIFDELIIRYNKDYSKIAHLYSVTETYVKIRHYIDISIKNTKKDIKTLKIENNQKPN